MAAEIAEQEMVRSERSSTVSASGSHEDSDEEDLPVTRKQQKSSTIKNVPKKTPPKSPSNSNRKRSTPIQQPATKQKIPKKSTFSSKEPENDENEDMADLEAATELLSMAPGGHLYSKTSRTDANIKWSNSKIALGKSIRQMLNVLYFKLPLADFDTVQDVENVLLKMLETYPVVPKKGLQHVSQNVIPFQISVLTFYYRRPLLPMEQTLDTSYVLKEE